MSVRSLRFRLTAWYAGLLVGALLVIGVSVYLGLRRYLDLNLQRTLASECRTIGSELLSQLPKKNAKWLESEINEAYAPEVNGRFIRVMREGGAVLYLSGASRDGAFDPAQVSIPSDTREDGVRKVRLQDGRHLLINASTFETADGSRFLIESGVTYEQVQVALRGLLVTFAIYVPLTVSLAIGGGYWLMRRSLRPVDEITDRAEGITSANLSERLPVIRTGDELERLSVALNRMIERIDEAFQHVNRFSADASHELRTPLTILQLALEAIARNRGLDPVVQDQVGSALEETHRMSRIVDSLLAISRLDAGEVKIDKAPLDLGRLAAATADAMKLLADERSITLRSLVSPGVVVEADRTRLQEVIVNLVDNAVKYTQAGGQVEIRVRRMVGTAVLEVSDNGPGIPVQALPHLFERFYRADKARSRGSGGAGLGLSIVKAICVAHGAEVRVSSTEGQGSTFRVDLPLCAAPETHDAATALSERSF